MKRLIIKISCIALITYSTSIFAGSIMTDEFARMEARTLWRLAVGVRSLNVSDNPQAFEQTPSAPVELSLQDRKDAVVAQENARSYVGVSDYTPRQSFENNFMMLSSGQHHRKQRK